MQAQKPSRNSQLYTPVLRHSISTPELFSTYVIILFQEISRTEQKCDSISSTNLQGIRSDSNSLQPEPWSMFLGNYDFLHLYRCHSKSFCAHKLLSRSKPTCDTYRNCIRNFSPISWLFHIYRHIKP